MSDTKVDVNTDETAKAVVADYEGELILVISGATNPSDLVEFLNGTEPGTDDDTSPAIRIEQILQESGQMVELNEVIVRGVRHWL